MYMSEVSTAGIRGTLVVLQQLSITLGILVSYWLEFGTQYIVEVHNMELQLQPIFVNFFNFNLSPSRYSLVSFSVSACFSFPNHLDTIVCVTTKRLVSERWPEFVAPTPMMNCYRKSIFLSKLKSCSKNNTTAKSFLASLGYRCTWLATRPFSPPGRPSSVRPLAAVSCSSSSLSGVMYVPIARIA